MRLLTRLDFDGLACATLLKEVLSIDAVEFCHPKDMQDGKIPVTENDIITNLPYHPNAGIWFDHHASEALRNGEAVFNGRYELAPSTARVVYNYFVEKGEGEKLRKYKQFLIEVDKVDSATLSPEDVSNPKGWVLLAYIMDPRSGLAKGSNYQISNYDLMMKLIDWMQIFTAEEILEFPDIKERATRYFDEEKVFKEALLANSRQDKNVIITDFRGMDAPAGNRFLIYSLFPEANISVRLIDGKDKCVTVIAGGHSIFNRTSKTDVGALMSRYGGGGHRGAGTCQIGAPHANLILSDIVAQMKKDG
ncbi:MAG: exopolyphosphatase [Chlorobiales bacterium]|nr:exopolyphosphatase [Chlorobiales bacterium]